MVIYLAGGMKSNWQDTVTEAKHAADFGAFHVGPLRILASPGCDEIPWEHVSVSRTDRCPTWEEMCQVKGWFWGPDEAVVQFHPRKEDYVNFHGNCLHMWRPTTVEIPTPPPIAVGPK